MSTLSLQRTSFYTFLMFVLALHAGFMAVQFKDRLAEFEWTPEEVIKIRLQDNTKSQNLPQVVQTEDSASTEKPDQAYLGDKDRKFDRQTVAKNVGTFKQAAKGNAQVTNKNMAAESSKKK